MLGLYNAPFEVTRQIRGARALQTLLTMGQETALAKSVSTFWPQLLRSLSDNVWDIPFAILYSVLEETDDESISQCSESSQSFRYCVLEGTLGIPDGHPATPQRIDLRRSTGGFVPAFRDAMQTREPKILTTKDGTLSESLIEGFEWRGFGEPSREAVVCPIRPTSGENVGLSSTPHYFSCTLDYFCSESIPCLQYWQHLEIFTLICMGQLQQHLPPQWMNE
jgi:hypothetical protein